MDPYFETIKKTLENTTQHAKAVSNYPMVKHMVARFKMLNRYRLDEVVSMDTVFATVQAHDKSNCAQVFYGVTSHMINVYGLQSKAQAIEAYRDFMKAEGVPSILQRDGAAEQRSQAFIQLNREMEVKDTFSEPGNPQQNPVESHAIRWLKKASQRLMNWVGAPDELWLAAFLYLADINNFTAHPALRWKTPYEKRHGVTPDISGLLVHHFYEPLWYLSLQTSFPKSTEKAGYFLFLNKNVGHALTFSVLDDTTGNVIATSVTRSRERSPHVNHRSIHDANWDPFVLRDVNNQNVPQKRTLSWVHNLCR
jgi:hypothetical protein